MHAGDDEQSDENRDGKRWAPLLVERVGGEQDEPVLLGDDGPARADPAHRSARLRLVLRRPPYRVDQRPLHEAPQRAHNEKRERQRYEGGEPGGEQVVAHPAPWPERGVRCVRNGFRHAGNGGFQGKFRGGLGHRPTSAVRALYQFISRLMLRLIVRNTSMMSAMPSIAWPVWLSMVLAIETMS